MSAETIHEGFESTWRKWNGKTGWMHVRLEDGAWAFTSVKDPTTPGMYWHTDRPAPKQRKKRS